jgi:NADH dehydrogenase
MSKLVTIFGGSGFVGSYIIKLLSENGFLIKLITSDVKKANKLKVLANPGHIVIVGADVSANNESLEELVKDSHIVINCIGSFRDKDIDNFTKIHSQLPEKIATACGKYNVTKFIHLSNLNIENVPTLYAKSRFLGEKAVLSFDQSVILKSNLVYGEEDKFVNILYHYAKKFSCLPILHRGKFKLQPIYVMDLAQAVLNICLNLDSYNGIYKIAGTEIMSLKDLYETLGRILNKKIHMIPSSQYLTQMAIKIMNFKIMTPINRMLFGQTEPPFYSEQLKMSIYDNIIPSPEDNLLNKMNFKTKSFEENLRRYLC